MDGAEYEHYEYEPGPRLGVRVSGAWARNFRGWAPDQRSLGVVLVAWYLGNLLNRLLGIDFIWWAFITALQPAPPFGFSHRLADVVFGAGRLLELPVLAAVVAGGVGLALRRRWGRGLAITGVAALLAIGVIETLVSMVDLHGPPPRFVLNEVVGVLASVLPLLVLLWSRPAPVDA
jgi:hypothetical protein